jgi:RNA polymerase sigma-70 factor (ECF subfamily)
MKGMKKLIESCIANDTKSQAKLYDLLKGKMLTTCYKYTRDTDTAHEIMQLGFIKLFNNLSKFDDKGSFEGWSVRVMKNTAIDYLRLVQRRAENFGFTNRITFDNEFEVVDVVEEDNIDELHILALESIEELSPAYKKTFTLNVIEEKQHKEIAQILGINEGTSKSNLFKAKIAMRKILSEKMLKKDLVY